MEKLQQALHKARSERAQRTAPETPDAVPAGPVGPAGVDALWAALSPIDMTTKLARKRIVSQGYGHNAAPFDILRTKLLMQMRRNGWKRLAITSPTPACGKSTIALNLALGLSRQPDVRAILFELDLRRPSMAETLESPPARDVTRVLTGEVDFADQAVRVQTNVALSLARRSAKDPTQYLLSHGTEEKLAEIEAAYEPDLMIFDMPPVMVTDDTRAFLDKVDCALIVARAEKTTVGQIDSCEREIAEHTNVVGVVLNQARFFDPDGGYGYGYGNYGE